MTPDLQAACEAICRDVCELPDRASPEGNPDWVMLSLDELGAILETRLEPLVTAALQTPAMVAMLEAAQHYADLSVHPNRTHTKMQGASYGLEQAALTLGRERLARKEGE